METPRAAHVLQDATVTPATLPISLYLFTGRFLEACVTLLYTKEGLVVSINRLETVTNTYRVVCEGVLWGRGLGVDAMRPRSSRAAPPRPAPRHAGQRLVCARRGSSYLQVH